VDSAPVFKALFEEVPMELCRYAVRLPDGGTIMAIRDHFKGGLTAPGRFMRFNQDWMPDFTFTNSYEIDVRSRITIKRQSDGKYLVAGMVGTLNGEEFPGLVRLNPDGQTDHSFHCQITPGLGGRVMDLVVQEDGRIVICGWFTEVNGVKRQHLARLNSDGSLDATFRNPFISMEQLNAIRFPVYPLSKASDTAATGRNTTAPVPTETILITSMNYSADGATIQFTGKPNQQYVLQATDGLNAADWRTISTNQSSANGWGSFRDPDAVNHPSRFYRIATP
jgi:uncharacterized delta-60 repeat protein